MLVMPDLEDPFVPLGSDGLFVDPYDSKLVSLSQIHFGSLLSRLDLSSSVS